MGIGDWGLGIGDWGLGTSPKGRLEMGHPQSPSLNLLTNHSYFHLFNFFKLHMEIYILNQSQKEKYKKRKSNHPNRITVIIILSLIVLILSIIIVYLYLHLNSQKAIIKELIRNNKNTPIKSDDREKTLYNNEDNQSKTPIINNINNNNSTLKNQYHIQLEKVFDKYKNELNDEEKKNLKKDILDGFSSLF